MKVPESIRFELYGQLNPACTAKDLMLQLLDTVVKEEKTLNRVMEFGGPGLKSISIDERATLCNMATECSAKSGICEVDELTIEWLKERRGVIPGLTRDPVELDPGSEAGVTGSRQANYAGGIHQINLTQVKPRVARPGDPTYGVCIKDLEEIKVDIAYGGSCTAGKYDDIAYYARVVEQRLKQNQSIPEHVKFYIQFGSKAVKAWSKQKGFVDLFEKAGVILLEPGCGACIGCGPGVSENSEQITVSAINRNFQGRSGPGQLYLASPLTVAASAFAGKIVSYDPA